MEILIKIDNGKIKLILLQNRKKVDSLNIAEEHALSEKLLPEINRLLKKNKLEFKEIKKILVKSDQGNNFTTTRIAKTVANTWNWVRK